MLLTTPISQEGIQYFLQDVERKSTIELLEGKEKNDLKAIAKAQGIDIEDIDLALFKTVYAFTDQANANGAILPQKELLKVLPTLRNKPININHQRRYVVGHYIDYSYITKENKIIAYGVFYKSNFGDEWAEAQKLFKNKKLSTSFEIWSEQEKRRYHENGSYELMDMLIAGGALIFEDKDNKPAFKDAKVLRLAHALIGNQKTKNKFGYNLEYSYIEDKDLIVASEQQTIAQPQELTIKCSNCQEEFTYNPLNAIEANVKCPKCKAIVDKGGQMVYAPQDINFSLLCPKCKVNSWLIKSTDETKSQIKCLQCKKEYEIEYEKKSDTDDIAVINAKKFYVYDGKVECPQCNYLVLVPTISSMTEKVLKCERCGLEFKHDIKKDMKKKLKSISEIIPQKQGIQKASKKGDNNMLKLEISKFHRYIDIDSAIDIEKEMWLEDYSKDIEMAEKLTYEQRKELSDSDFAVALRVKNKKDNKINKIRKYPMQNKAHVENTLAMLKLDSSKDELKGVGISVDTVLKTVYQKAKELGMNILLIKSEEELTRLGLSAPIVKAAEEVEKSEAKLKGLVRQAVTRIIATRKELKDTSKNLQESKTASNELKEKLEKAAKDLEESKKSVTFYKENAQEVIKRRKELASFSEGLSDESLLNDDKFEKAKLLKENTELKGKMEKSSTSIGDQNDLETSADETKKIKDEIDKLAFGE